MKKLAEQTLPSGFSYDWTDLSYQQVTGGNQGLYVFPICVLFVFLVLAAQYGSWSLPFAVILIVPMCLLAATIRSAYCSCSWCWRRSMAAGACRSPSS